MTRTESTGGGGHGPGVKVDLGRCASKLEGCDVHGPEELRSADRGGGEGHEDEPGGVGLEHRRRQREAGLTPAG